MNDKLEKNLLFNTLMTKYSKFYDTASEECCLFVVPRNKYLKYVNINESFIINHILKPSKLLKSHYTPYKKSSILDVEIVNNYLFVQRENEKDKDKIDIIGEEIAYNEDNKSYKILLVEKPLIKFKINPSQLKEEPLQSIYFTFEECESYLTALSPLIVKEIKEKVDKFLKTYLILPDYLEDAAAKIKGLIDWSVQKYSNGIVAPFDEEVLISSLECYILALTYDKVYPVIKVQCSNEEQELIEQLKRMEKEEDMHFVNIGCNKLFRTYQPSTQIYDHLNCSILKKSPLEKIFIYKKILDTINNELNEFLNFKLYSPFSKCKYEVLTDDLVAIVVYILIKFNLNNLNKNKSNSFLVSEFRYIQNFSFYLDMSSSAYGYAMTTFEVAVNYIKDKHFEFNETPTKSLKKSTSKSKSSLKNKRRALKESSNDSSINDHNLIKKDIRKQLTFSSTSVKMDEDLEKISQLIENNSFSFQQLENAD